MAKKTRNLTPEEAAYVDARIAPSADGRVSWTRFETLVEAAIKAADPEPPPPARTKPHATSSPRPPTRPSTASAGSTSAPTPPPSPGSTPPWPTSPTPCSPWATTHPLTHRRVKACLILANPTQAVKILAAYGRLRDQILTDTATPRTAPEPERFDPVGLDPARPRADR